MEGGRMDTASRQQVCDELSRAGSFLAKDERKDRAGTTVPSLRDKEGVKFRRGGECGLL